MATGRCYACVVVLIYFGIIVCAPIEEKTAELERLKIDNLQHDYTSEIGLLKQQIISLQERVLKLEIRSSGTENRLVPSEITYDTKESPADHLLNKRAIRIVRRRIPEVAFQASLTKDYITVQINDAIIFNDIITNIGGAYNKHTGIFTAPLAGSYSFNTNIVSGEGHYVEAAIEVNGKATVSAISDHRTSPNSDYLDIWDQGNAAAILKLQRGDNVRVSVQWPQGSHVIHGVGKSSFSGYLLRSHERL